MMGRMGAVLGVMKTTSRFLACISLWIITAFEKLRNSRVKIRFRSTLKMRLRYVKCM